MKLVILGALVCTLSIFCEGAFQPVENHLSSEHYPCIKCLCHAISGCWLRQNCGRYSIDKNYWMQAGSLLVSPEDDPSSDDSFQKCLRNENCIVGTIIKYTEQFGQLDCNCDGKFDCKDRLAIHLFGNKCEKPSFGSFRAVRFNHCATSIGVDAMLQSEGTDNDCTMPEVY